MYWYNPKTRKMEEITEVEKLLHALLTHQVAA